MRKGLCHFNMHRCLLLFQSNMSQFEGRVDGGFISFAIGAPNDALLDLASEIFRRCSQQLGKTPDTAQLFQYGPNAGSKVFLDYLASFLSDEYGDNVCTDNLLLTCGATHGLHFAASTLISKRGVVFVENPTYFIALDILGSDLGLKTIGFDYDGIEDAINLEKSSALTTGSSNRFWGLIYVIPTFHNPTGRYLMPEYCKKLILLAVKHNLLIICDDVYNLLHYNKEIQPPTRLYQFNKSCPNIISNGSFSKIVAPGYRVGWIEAAPQTIERLSSSGVLSSGGATNNVMSGVVANAIKEGLLKKHLRYLREEYGKRMRATCQALSQLLPVEFSFLEPHGGYFIWISGPALFNGSAFAEFCSKSEHKIHVLPGERATVHRNSDDPIRRCVNSFRLSIAHYFTKELVEGVERLARALNEFLNETTSPNLL